MARDDSEGLRLGFLASGNASAMRAIVGAIDGGRLKNAQAVVLITNRAGSPAVGFARDRGLPHAVLNEKTCGTEEALDAAVCEMLLSHAANTIVLSGYLRKLGKQVLSRFAGRILNVHPALLPDFGGKGMYGDRVHQAVLGSGASVSGATVHLVTEAYDEGPIVGQMAVPVPANRCLEDLRARVNEVEAALIVRVLSTFGNRGPR